MNIITDTRGQVYVPESMLSADRAAIVAEAVAERLRYAKALRDLNEALAREHRRVRQLRRAVLAWAYKYECLGASEFGASLSDETCRGLYDRARDRSHDDE